MPIWATRPVDQVPEITLRQWAVFELLNGDRHFAGQNVTEGEGRTSSRIVTFDPVSRRGVTRSGRVYTLDGPPGLGGDGSYTWNRWCFINRVDPATAVDVSAAVVADT